MNRFLLLITACTAFQTFPQSGSAGMSQDTPSQAVEIGREDAQLSAMAQEVMAEVAALRGREYQGQVRARYADKATLLAYLESSEVDLFGKDRKQWDQWVARLLGWIPVDMDLSQVQETVLASQVGGFYDPKTKVFFVMDGLGEGLIRIIMAHELAHALDDQAFDLLGQDRLRQAQSDALYAHHAVAEGSAQVVMGLWMAKHLADLDTAALEAFQEQMDFDLLSNTPRIVWQPLFGLYTQGQAFLCRKERPNPFAKAKIADLQAAFEHLPVSTEQILHPSKYWVAEEVDLPVALVHEVPLDNRGWDLVHTDVLGEMLLAMLAESRTQKVTALGLMGLRFTNQAASGWGGDRVSLLRKGESYVLVLDTVWDRELDAQEFQAALEQRELGPDSAPGLVMWSAPDGVRYVGYVGVSREEALEVAASVQVSRAASGKIPASEAPKATGPAPDPLERR
ncbi:MAG: hypothetical protein H6830_00225 [Planctomycetes bacterium]|nr:hypothetical protein [Planctomycetota bacterium]MCB9912786.1 hypothetical protein [Planctomycetota bacterium]HPF14330.1 hypothetical protein [Planctomycetota bacterium]